MDIGRQSTLSQPGEDLAFGPLIMDRLMLLLLLGCCCCCWDVAAVLRCCCSGCGDAGKPHYARLIEMS